MKYLYSLRLILIGVLLTLLSVSAKAQIPACSTYVFTTSTETFNYISGSTSASAIHCDDCITTNIPLSFNFPFCGNNYNTVSVGSNGYICLNNTSFVYLSGSTSALNTMGPTLFPMWGDEWGTSGANASYVVTGTAPNRVFTFEWKNWRPFSYSANPEYTMQARLYETSGRIQFVYKREGSAARPGMAIGIGYSGSDYQSLPLATSAPAPSSTVFTTSISSYPATGQVYQWDPPTPCAKATGFTVTSFNSQAASFSWTGISGSVLDYQYAVDTRADLAPNVATTITNTVPTVGSRTGLTPATTYYLHVRTRCSAVSISQWDTISFRTLPECTKPGKLVVAAVDTNSATFQWPAVSTATNYQYIVTATKLTPTGGAATSTTSPSVSKTGLTEGTWYYVYYRTLCPNVDSSAWMLDSFYTPIPCRRPQTSLTYLSSNRAVAFWPAVNTAYEYEYYLATSNITPTLGTPLKTTSVQVTALLPKTTYDLFVRCKCRDNGVLSVSPWSLLEFATQPPTGISNVGLSSVFINLYPNPAESILNVEVSGSYSNRAVMYITDITGKTLQVVNVTDSKVAIDVKTLASGIYFVKFIDGENTKVMRFNKQ